MRASTLRHFGLSLAGACLLGLPGQRYRVDQISCATWPSLGTNLGYALIYLLAVGLLTVGWLGLAEIRSAAQKEGAAPRQLGQVLGLGLLVHAAACLGLPCLSEDPLCYAAVGRAMATFHQSAFTPLRQSLPPGDPFLVILPPHWQQGGSSYWVGFNQLSRAIGYLAGDSLSLHLRLYQLLGALCMLLTAALTGVAVRTATQRREEGLAGDRKDESPAAAGARAASLVIFCPLAVIEGTQNAHNDGLLAVAAAGFALCVVRRRAGLGALALVLGLLAKASMALLLLLHVGRLFVLRLRLRIQPRQLLPLGLLLGLLGLALTVGLAQTGHGSARLAPLYRLLGSPADPYDYCTRSVECLPRVVLRWLLHAPTAAWVVGLCFRVAAGLWLGYVVLRSREQGHVLRWALTGLFGYYLYLHSWSQSWYFLPLLPLLPYGSPRVYRAMLALCVSSVAFYALLFLLACAPTHAGIALRDLSQALILIVPPTCALLRRRTAPLPIEESA